jgi:hypothetical protein
LSGPNPEVLIGQYVRPQVGPEPPDGKIVEITQYCDLFTILNQIGALPTAAPA